MADVIMLAIGGGFFAATAVLLRWIEQLREDR